jgi:hypothetical protein
MRRTRTTTDKLRVRLCGKPSILRSDKFAEKAFILSSKFRVRRRNLVTENPCLHVMDISACDEFSSLIQESAVEILSIHDVILYRHRQTNTDTVVVARLT